MSALDPTTSPLLLDAGDLDPEMIDPQTVEELIRAEQQGTPSVLWATTPEDLTVPVASLVTHVAVPTTAETVLQEEARGRFGPEQVLTAEDPAQACDAVRARREAERAAGTGGGAWSLRGLIRRARRRLRARAGQAGR